MTIPVWKGTGADLQQKLSELRERLAALQGMSPSATAGSARDSVTAVLDAVRVRGDAAVLEFTERFDGCRLTVRQLRVSEEEVDRALEDVSAELLDALQFAAQRIRDFQTAILFHEPAPVTVGGRTMRLRLRPVDSAGVYVPGGSASLASSVLMSAVPARVAGVERIVMVTPPRPDGSVSPDRLAAARVAGVREIYRIGGAQAIGALAYGTDTIQAVDFIAGPGSIYVTLAKRAVFGQVGIEMLPGPSEVVIIADDSANPQWVAADLVAQAEHSPGSAVLITDDKPLADEVARAVEDELSGLPEGAPVRRCLSDYGAILAVGSLDECARMANELAPEHLEIMTRDPEALCGKIRHAGAIFLGPFSPVAVGDYVAGPSHVLPTGTTARFSSGLTANDFLKGSSVIEYTAEALREDSARLAAIADAEGLTWHARSVKLRTDADG